MMIGTMSRISLFFYLKLSQAMPSLCWRMEPFMG